MTSDTVVQSVKRRLRSTSVGRSVYPVCRACYRLYSKRRRQRLLRRYGYEAIQRIHEALTNANVSYFVDLGTLLGLVRDQALISHDVDLDVALPPGAQTLCEACLALQRYGFAFHRAFTYNGQVAYSNMRYKGILVDLCKYYMSESNETMFCYNFYRDEKGSYQSLDQSSARRAIVPSVTECVTQRIHGVDVCLPINAEAVLAAEYGEQWRIPDAHWQDEDVPNFGECCGTGYAVDLVQMQSSDRWFGKE